MLNITLLRRFAPGRYRLQAAILSAVVGLAGGNAEAQGGQIVFDVASPQAIPNLPAPFDTWPVPAGATPNNDADDDSLAVSWSVLAAICASKAAGPSTTTEFVVNFPLGTYDLFDVVDAAHLSYLSGEAPGAVGWNALVLSGRLWPGQGGFLPRNITLAGNGSKAIVHRLDYHLFKVQGAINLKVRDLTFDYYERVYTMGVVTDYDRCKPLGNPPTGACPTNLPGIHATKWIDVVPATPPTGAAPYDDPTDNAKYSTVESLFPNGAPETRHACLATHNDIPRGLNFKIYDPVTRRMKRDTTRAAVATICAGPAANSCAGNAGLGQFRLNMRNGGAEQNVEVGDLVYIGADTFLQGLVIDMAFGVELDAVKILQAGSFGMKLFRCAGLHVHECEIVPRPGEITSSMTDGIHIIQPITGFVGELGMSFGAPVVENCVFEGTGDDAIAAHGAALQVVAVEPDRDDPAYRLVEFEQAENAKRSASLPRFMLNGETFIFTHGGALGASANSTPVTYQSFAEYELSLPADLVAGDTPFDALRFVGAALTLRLPASLGLGVGDIAESKEDQGIGAVFHANRMKNVWASGFRVRLPLAQITDNLIETIALSAVTMGPDFGDFEMGYGPGAVVSGNTIRDTGLDSTCGRTEIAAIHSGIRADTGCTYPDVREGGVLTISNNRFEGVRGMAIFASNRDHVEVSDNVVVDVQLNPLQYDDPRFPSGSMQNPFHFQSCNSVALTDNVIEAPTTGGTTYSAGDVGSITESTIRARGTGFEPFERPASQFVPDWPYLAAPAVLPSFFWLEDFSYGVSAGWDLSFDAQAWPTLFAGRHGARCVKADGDLGFFIENPDTLRFKIRFDSDDSDRPRSVTLKSVDATDLTGSRLTHGTWTNADKNATMLLEKSATLRTSTGGTLTGARIVWFEVASGSGVTSHVEASVDDVLFTFLAAP